MPRYIDADALRNEFSERPPDYYSTSYILDSIDSAPTVSSDVVRGVVHCGECKFWRRPTSCEGLARCETGETGIRYRSKNDFCSRGAKMEVNKGDKDEAKSN